MIIITLNLYFPNNKLFLFRFQKISRDEYKIGVSLLVKGKMQYFAHPNGIFVEKWDLSFTIGETKYQSGVKAKHPEICKDPQYNPNDYDCLPDGFRKFPYQQWENNPSGSISIKNN